MSRLPAMINMPSFLPPLLVCVLLVAGGLGTEQRVSQEQTRIRQQAVQEGLQRLYALRARIETELSASLYLASGVEASIRANRGVIKSDEMRRVLAVLYGRSHTIRNIGIAPDNRIAYVYPLSGNERALGLYYPDHPEQWPGIEKVIRLRAPFLAGPIPLVQGGEGLIYRVPVFLDDGSYWGLISTVIETHRLWQRVGLSEESAGRVLIVGKDAQGASGGSVYGVHAAATPDHSWLSIDIAVPGGNWRLLGQPSVQVAQGNIVLIRLAGGLLTLLLAAGMLYVLINTRRLARLNADLELSRDAAEAANRARGSFLAVMSHEVRTPLNGVMGMTQLLLASGLSPVQADYARTARSCAESLLVIMDDILDYSLIDSGVLHLKEERFDMLALIEDAAEPFVLRARDKGLEFSWIISPALPESACADPVRIRQLVGHVLSNAVKFTSTGAVVLSVGPDEVRPECLHLVVRDTGIGIKAEDLAHLFEPFAQVDSSSTRRFGGTGIGLSLCHRLLALMGGSIEVDSQVDQGSSFHLRIPVRQWQGRLDVSPAVGLLGATVLLVSPSSMLRAALLPWLSVWGAQVREVLNGIEALAELDRLAAIPAVPSLILVDQTEMAGGELLWTRLENDGRLRGCACIRFLASCSVLDVPSGGSQRRVALLPKPVRPASLARVVAALLASSEIADAAPMADAASDGRGHWRILLVEDNLINQKVALAMLGLLNLQTEVVCNGREAVDALSQGDYDLVLMDLQMPEMDGFEATRIIRDVASGVRRHDIPVIALTANVLESQRDECFAVGMNDFLSKPLAQDRLLEVLSRFLPGFSAPED